MYKEKIDDGIYMIVDGVQSYESKTDGITTLKKKSIMMMTNQYPCQWPNQVFL